MPAPAQLFVNLELVAEGFTAPVDLAEPRDGSGRLFIADQIGLIRVLSPDGTLLPQPLLDLRARIVALEPGYDERGLLGFALHPDFATPGSDGAGLFYVYYSAPRNEATPSDYDHTGRLSAFRMMADDVNRADLFSEQVILEIPEPQFNHNGGQVAFGPDGYLYLGLGDGGAQNDSGIGHEDAGNGQSLYTLLGKILRLDVIHPAPQHPYSIPWDNPFGGGGGDPLIFAYGFRNPYRFSFDAGGAYGLLVADVGQNLYEEINQVTLGGNYGWRIREGYTCFDVANADAPLASCASTGATGEPLLDPIMAYDRSVGRSVIGGFVYRGQDVPALVGRYVFGDWEYDAQGRLRLFTGVPTATGEWVRSPLTVGAGSPDLNPYSYLLAFGQDANLSLYALTTQALGPAGSSGKVFRLVRAVRP
ncbi:MAG: PQQ-dependent sugar dehydrogenase [Ardenticatenales bacterium]|nr:PQQ-dependent sugar dehydrogenase [Ardenticatenales bacterium]